MPPCVRVGAATDGSPSAETFDGGPVRPHLGIRAEQAELLGKGRPHPPGACAFLDGEGACRVYDSRPYRCRTQGLPLRWFDEGPFGEPVEDDVVEVGLWFYPEGEEPRFETEGDVLRWLGELDSGSYEITAEYMGPLGLIESKPAKLTVEPAKPTMNAAAPDVARTAVIGSSYTKCMTTMTAVV